MPRGTPGAQKADELSHRQRSGVLGAVFDRLAAPARAAAVSRINSSSGRILEIGVGTGQTVAKVRGHVELVGVDRHFPALRIAAARRHRVGGDCAIGVACSGYGGLPFADRTFDGVLASFIMVGLADPAGAFAEIDRVVRPGGEIIVVDYFAHEHRWWERIERLTRPLVGEAPSIAPIIDRLGLSLTASRRLPPLGLFSIVTFRKEDEGAITAWRISSRKRHPRPASSGRRRRSRSRTAMATKSRR